MDETRTALAPGSALDGFRIDRVLADGRFAVVYLAAETAGGRRAAIKEYLPVELSQRRPGTAQVSPAGNRDDFAWGLARFRDEAAFLARLDHPAVVRTPRWFEANGTAYAVMEYLEGETLADKLMRRGTLGEAEALGLLRPLADGLRAIHRAGGLHGDVKPSHIVVRHGGEPVLIEFGTAQNALAHRASIMFGIVAARYAPFEKYTGDGKQGPWTDLYGLGATLYHCVTGTSPILAPERIVARLRGEADPLRPAQAAGAGRFSPALLRAIDAALAPFPEDRPRDIDAFMALLERGGA
mgnify:CR=1 FL=1